MCNSDMRGRYDRSRAHRSLGKVARPFVREPYRSMPELPYALRPEGGDRSATDAHVQAELGHPQRSILRHGEAVLPTVRSGRETGFGLGIGGEVIVANAVNDGLSKDMLSKARSGGSQ